MDLEGICVLVAVGIAQQVCQVAWSGQDWHLACAPGIPVYRHGKDANWLTRLGSITQDGHGICWSKVMERVEQRAEAAEPSWHGFGVHKLGHECNPAARVDGRLLKRVYVRESVSESEMDCEALGGQRLLQCRNRPAAARAEIDHVVCLGRSQGLAQQSHDRAMERKFCFDKMEVVGGEVPDNGGTPRLIFELEQVDSWEFHFLRGEP